MSTTIALFIFACLTFVVLFVYIMLKIVSRYVYSQEEIHSTKPRRHIRPPQESRRDMGPYESYLADLDFQLGTKIYAVIFLKSSITLRRETVRNTLVLLSRKHPLLRAYVDTHARGYSFFEDNQDCDSKRKQFVFIEEKHFKPELQFVNTSHWRIVLEENLLMQKADHNVCNSLWKTILLREQYHARERLYTNTLLFFFGQVIMDRRSVVHFIKDFASFLCKLVSCDIHVGLTRAVKLELPLEDLVKQPPFWKSVRFVVEDKMNGLINYNISSAVSSKKTKQCKNKPLFLTQTFSSEETNQLLRRCTDMNCSLASLFIVAWLETQNGSSGNGYVPKKVSNKRVSVVTDLRSSLSTRLPSSFLGNSSSNVLLSLTAYPPNKLCWKSVQQCEQLVNCAVKSNRHLEFIWKLQYCDPRTVSQFTTGKSSFEIAEVGKFIVSRTPPYLLENFYIGASGVSKMNLTLVIVDDQLNCGMHFSSPLNESKCKSFFSALIARVVQCACC